MPSHDDYEGVDLEGTVRNLHVLAEAPGELRFRQGVAASFEKVTDKLSRIEIRLTKIEERMLSRSTVAEIAQKEIAVLTNKVETLNRMVWGLLGAGGSGLILLAITKVFK
jgi:hypothetical protein